MITVYIDNKDVTNYIVEDDFDITISCESEIDLLSFTDNFTLSFYEGLYSVISDLGGQDFKIQYNKENIIIGRIINEIYIEKEEIIKLEFGTIDYLFSQSIFSLPKGEKQINNLLRAAIRRVPYGIDIDSSNEVKDFGAYYTYTVNEVAAKSDLNRLLDISEPNDIISKYTGFFQKFNQDDVYLYNNAAIWGDEGNYNVSIYKDNYYFGHLIVGRPGIIGEAGGTLHIYGIFYNIVNGDIDFSNHIELSIEKYVGSPTKYVFGMDNDLIITKGDLELFTDESVDFEIYKFYNSFNWDNNERQEETKQKTIEFIKAEAETKYYTPEEVDSQETDINVLSLFYDKKTVGKGEEKQVERSLYENTLFVTISVDGNKKLLSFYLGMDDIFHYYFDNAKGKKLLKDLAIASDNLIVFKGRDIIIADRNGIGNITVNDNLILDRKIKIQHIEIDKEKLDNFGTSGGYENGIVILDLEYPFNVLDIIKRYYSNLQNGKKQVTELTILSDGLSSKNLIGKSINDYGMIQEITYKDETIEIRAEKRL